MRKNELDEMQLQRRNKFGNQAFMLLFYLLMIDIGLYGFGVHWLQYPINVFIIMLTCMSYYLIRIIWSNAYIGPDNKNKTVGKKTIYITAIAGFIAAITIFLSQKGLLENQAKEASGNGALILFLISTVAIIIAALVSIIRNKRNKGSGD